MVLTTDGRLVHKRCALLLRGSIYSLRGSCFSENRGEEPLERTLAQFVLPAGKCMGLTSNETWARRRGVRPGSTGRRWGGRCSAWSAGGRSVGS